MGEVQPWRRMLPHNTRSSRSRTPIPLGFDDLDARDCGDRSERNSFLLAPEPVQSKKHSRPKFLTRASQYFGSTKERLHDRLSPAVEKRPPKDLEYANIDVIIDNVFTRIASNLGQSLAPQNNEPVLRILEAYRGLEAEKGELKAKLAQAVSHCNTTLDTLEGERKRWKEDETNYRHEIKRLEVLIANGKMGLSEVALARQHSLIRREKQRSSTVVTVDEDKENTYSYIVKGRQNSEPNVQRGMPFLNISM
jgi:hypothetical protein